MNFTEMPEAQRMANLRRANELRLYRRNLKSDLAGGLVTFAEVLPDDDERMATMTVADLIRAVPGFRDTKVRRALIAAQMTHSTQIRGVSMERRDKLIAWLLANHPKAGRGIA